VNLLYIFATFFRIGFFAIGGGLATLPFLFELADRSDWLTREAVGNMLAVAQSLPGAIGVNLAAYTGFRYASTAGISSGVPGAYLAALGLIAPSIIIIIIVAGMFQAFKESTIIKRLFSGFRPAAAGLLSAAGLGAIALSLYNAEAPVWYELLRWRETLLFIAIFVLVHKLKKHPVLYIFVAGAAGIALNL
jgi:chromate transporter